MAFIVTYPTCFSSLIFPSTLDTTYSDALELIYSQAPNAVYLAEAVLFRVLYAKRPPMALELQQMHATQEPSKDVALQDDDVPDGIS